MRYFRMPTVSLFLIYCLMINLAGCSGGGSGTSSSNAAQAATTTEKLTLQQQLTNFNTSMDDTADNMLAIIETLKQLETAFATDDDSKSKSAEIGALVDKYKAKTDLFIASVDKVDLAETGIQNLTKQTGKHVEFIIPLIFAGVAIAGLYSFGKAMKGYSDEVSAARVDRDKAADGVTNNVVGADAAYTNAKTKMKISGTAAITELVTKVTTDVVLSPLNPTTLSTLIIKEVAGNVLQDGLKVISASEKCSSGYTTSGCTIGVSKTDSKKPATVPSGKSTVIVGGGGKNIARTVINDKVFVAGKATEVTRKEIPVATATATTVNQNDGIVTAAPVTPEPAVSAKTLTLSQTKSSEDSTSITYTVSAALTGVTAPTSVTSSVQNGGTGGSTKSVSANGTVTWSITVLQQDATVTVTRLDTGEMQTLSLPGKGVTAAISGTWHSNDGGDWIFDGSSGLFRRSGWAAGNEEPFTYTTQGDTINLSGVSWLFTGGSGSSGVYCSSYTMTPTSESTMNWQSSKTCSTLIIKFTKQ